MKFVKDDSVNYFKYAKAELCPLIDLLKEMDEWSDGKTGFKLENRKFRQKN